MSSRLGRTRYIAKMCYCKSGKMRKIETKHRVFEVRVRVNPGKIHSILCSAQYITFVRADLCNSGPELWVPASYLDAYLR